MRTARKNKSVIVKILVAGLLIYLHALERFDEKDVEAFYFSFEKLAKQMNRPRPCGIRVSNIVGRWSKRSISITIKELSRNYDEGGMRSEVHMNSDTRSQWFKISNGSTDVAKQDNPLRFGQVVKETSV